MLLSLFSVAIMESKDCIIISDDEEACNDVSVLIIEHVKKNNNRGTSNSLDASLIDLTNGDDTFKVSDDVLLHSPDIPPPTPLSPKSYSGTDADNNVDDVLTTNNNVHSASPSKSPPLFSSPSPSPPLYTRTRSSTDSQSSQHKAPPSRTTRGRLPRTQQSPSKKSPKLNKLAREEARKLKLRQKQEENLQKEANRANAANKALQNCTAIIDKNILEVINDEEEISLRTLFDESMLTYRYSEHSKIENSIMWSYKRFEVEDNQCVSKFKDADWIIVVMPGNDYLKHILKYRDNPNDSGTLEDFICDIRRRSKCDVILMVYNLANYLKNERLKDAKNYRKNFKNRFEGTSVDVQNIDELPQNNAVASIGTTDLQDLRLMLEVDIKHKHPSWKFHFEFYEKTQEVVHAIVRYTSSIAKFEVKRKTKSVTNLDWAINMDKEKAVDPSKSSEDLTKLWITQLQQFSQITLPIAKAIAAEYPSPSALLDQYKTLTTNEAEDLLAELYVQRNLKRQIGPNISRKIHCFMTCKDPDVHIGYG